ncbi:MAG: 1-deoxy-D-xylulose-5-phosphate reductoisomerase [bacterium]
MTESIAILGATGSVGVSALDVIRRHRDQYRVHALAANRNVDALRAQCREFAPELAVMADADAGARLAEALSASCANDKTRTNTKTRAQKNPNPRADTKTRIAVGDDGLIEAAQSADIVICGIVGAAGLRSTLAAVRAGKKVLIANKEPLVMLGRAIMREARARGATVIPLDSEHNAIFQCLPQSVAAPSQSADASEQAGDARAAGICQILLTGSGGPFLRLPLAQFAAVTAKQACAHPTWRMGPKISVDSATMMNKGLELIEACALFALEADDIDIVVHPQSIVHSLVEYIDGSILAQLASPDMRVPIANALGWPRRIHSGARRLSLLECARFDFEAPDHRRFPSLRLAREAARAGGAVPTAMNAANEVAVEAFLGEALAFDQIPRVVERVMERAVAWKRPASECNLDDALAADFEARRLCRELL